MTDSAEPILEPGNQRLADLWEATHTQSLYRAALEAEVLELYVQRDSNRKLLELYPKLVAALEDMVTDYPRGYRNASSVLAQARALQGDS